MDVVMTKGTHTSVIVPAVWSANYYEKLLAELPFNDLIERDYEGEITKLGDQVRIPTVPEFAEPDFMAEDDVVEADGVVIESQTLTINKRLPKDFIVTDLAVLQSLPFMDKLKNMAAYAIMKKMQKQIIADLIPSAAAPDHAIPYDSGTTLALADLLEGKELMDAANVPLSERHMFLGSAAINDVFNVTGFTSSDFLTAGAPLQTGEIPSALLGFMPHFTTEVGTVTYLFHKSCMTIASQKGMSVKEYDLGVIGKRAVRVNMDTLYGQKLLDNKRLVTLS